MQAVLKRNLLPRRVALEGWKGVVDRFEIQKVERVLKLAQGISRLRCTYVGLSGLGGLDVVFVLPDLPSSSPANYYPFLGGALSGLFFARIDRSSKLANPRDSSLRSRVGHPPALLQKILPPTPILGLHRPSIAGERASWLASERTCENRCLPPEEEGKVDVDFYSLPASSHCSPARRLGQSEEFINPRTQVLTFCATSAHAARTSSLLLDPAEKSASRRKTCPAEKRHMSLRSALRPSFE